MGRPCRCSKEGFAEYRQNNERRARAGSGGNLVLLGRRQDAVEVVEALAQAFRYTLERASQLGPLSSELKYVQAYLKIQQMRFGSRLKTDVDVTAEARRGLLPHLCLQTLVENACQHGLELNESAGHLTVKGWREGANLVLQVIDDGRGTRETTDLDLMVASPEEAGPLLVGLGLRNLRGRLEGHYSGRASLCFRSTPGRGATVTLSLPYVCGADEHAGGEERE